MTYQNAQPGARYVFLVLLALLALTAACVESLWQGHILKGVILMVVLGGMGWLFLPAMYRASKAKVLLILIGGPVLFGFLMVGGDLESRRMDIYVQAKPYLFTSQNALSVFGEGLRIGWPIDSSWKIAGDEGNAAFDVPISGSKAKGRMIVVGTKTAGAWKIDDLYALKQGSSKRIEIQH